MILREPNSIFQMKYWLECQSRCSDNRLSWPQGGTLDFPNLMNRPAPSKRCGRPLISPSFLFLFPWSVFTNSKANGSRVPKFNLINTLCGDLQRPNVLLERQLLRSAYSTAIETPPVMQRHPFSSSSPHIHSKTGILKCVNIKKHKKFGEMVRIQTTN